MSLSDVHHVYGGRIELCSFYDQYFDLKAEPYWRSVGSRHDVEDVIDDYFKPIPEVDPLLVDSLLSVLGSLDDFVKPCVPLSDEDALFALPNNTSAGYPYSKNNLPNKGDCKDKIMNDYKKGFNDVVKSKRFSIPCLAGLRLALARKPRNKPRVVWVYPAVVQLSEAKYFMPLYSQLYNCKYFSWNFSFLRGQFEEIRYWLNSLPCHYGTDVSKFDSTVSAELLDVIFDWIMSKYALTWEQVNEFKAVRDYFINTPLWYQDRLFLKRRGVPSGSFFTQFVDSLVNLAYQLYLARTILDCHYLTMEQIFHFIRVLGDDSLCGIKHKYADRFSLQKFTLAVQCLEESGIIMHPDKGYYFNQFFKNFLNEPEFLGFSFKLNCVYTYPLLSKSQDLVYAQCLFPESKEKDPGMSYARLVGIKWSAGDDEDTLNIVNDFFDLLTERYPDITPTTLPREFEHLFRYVFGRLKIDPSYFPSNKEVIDRYRERNRRDLDGYDYHMMARMTHKVANIRQLFS